MASPKNKDLFVIYDFRNFIENFPENVVKSRPSGTLKM